MLLSYKPSLELKICSLWISLVFVRISLIPDDIEHNEDKKAAELAAAVWTPKPHFKFEIPIWKSGRTCAYGDTRAVCRECLTKVLRDVNDKMFHFYGPA